MFKLLRYYSISSAFVIMLVAAAVGHFYQWYEIRRMTSAAVQQNTDISATLIDTIWSRHATYLDNLGSSAPTTLKQAWQTTDIDLIVRQSVMRLPVVMVQIISPNGVIIYSSDLAEVGNNKSQFDRRFDQAISAGTSYQRSSNPTFRAFAGPATNLEIVTTSHAVHDASGRVKAVLEVHSDITSIAAGMTLEILRAILFAVGVCGILYASLYLVVARADRLMKQQYRDLSTFNTRIESEVLQRTKRMQIQQQMLGEMMQSPILRDGSLTEAIAALNEAAVVMLGIERCSVYAVTDNHSGCDLVDLYDTRTQNHTSGFYQSMTIFPAPDSGHKLPAVRTADDIEFTALLAPDYLDYLRARSIRAALDVPIYLDGRYVAALCMHKYDFPRIWTAEDRLCASAIANLAALTLQRVERQKAEARIVDNAAKLNSQQAVLTELMRVRATRSTNLQEELQGMSKALATVLGIDRAGIWLLDQDKTGFTYAEVFDAATGNHVPGVGTRAHNTRIVGLHEQVQGTVAINDIATNPLIDSATMTFLKTIGIMSLIRAPIVINNELAGVISCATINRQTAWTPEQTLFATSLGNLAALAVERHQRQRAEWQIAADAHVLSRQQAVLNELLQADDIRNGSLTAALRLLARTFADEASVDRVSIIVLTDDGGDTSYFEAYIRARNIFESPFVTKTNALIAEFVSTVQPGHRIVANDAMSHPGLERYQQDLFKPLDIRSFAQFPIDIGGRVVGVINASVCGRQIEWSTSQLLFGTALANLAALAFERDNRRRAETAIAATATRLEAQQAALSAFMRGETMQRARLDEAMRHLSETTAQTLEVERVSIWRFHGDRNAIVAINAFDTRDQAHTSGQTLTRSDHGPYIDAILTTGELVANDVKTDPCTASLLTTYVPNTQVCSILDMPIISEGITIGIVCAEKCGQAIVWSQEQKLFVAAVTGLAALFIERHERQKVEADVAASAAQLSDKFKLINQLMDNNTVRNGSLSDALRELTRGLCIEADADLITCRILPTASNNETYSASFDARTGQHSDIEPHRDSDSPAPSELDQLRQHVALNDVTKHAPIMAQFGPLIGKLQIGSALQVPIILHGSVIGVIRVMTLRRRTIWRPVHIMLATAIAQLAALAIERNLRMRVESSLRHANHAAELANRTKSLFLANMSHEIRTPMNGVFGMTDLLLRTQLTERQNRLVNTINQSAKALLTIINDILDLSRIESGKIALDHQAFDLRQCVEGAIELFTDDAQRKGIELNLFVSTQTPEHVCGDAVRLRQVCVNLIGNALKFTHVGEIALHVTADLSSAKNNTVRFEIRDTGIGVEPNVKDRLFQPFSQADDTITRRFGGTGLGLSISRHLVEMMQGEIALESTPGKGTSVTFVIPFQAAAAEQVVARAEPATLAGKRVLVVDDRDSNREIIVDYLAAAGAVPVNARSAEMALDLLTSAAEAGYPYQAAVVDMIMPGINGIELCERIRADQRIAKTGLVMVTSMSWDGDIKTARSLGLTQLLTKPLRRSELLDAVSRAVGSDHDMPRPIKNPASTDQDKTSWSGTRILVAEDNPVNVEVMQEFLSLLGCAVVIAGNGAEAVSAYQSQPFDIILMDCQMPDMDGLTASRRIRAIEAGGNAPRTPIIAVTANAFAEDRDACRVAGMDDYLSKPFSQSQLSDVLTRWQPARSAGQNGQADLDDAKLSSLKQAQPQLFYRLLTTYLAHSPKMLSALSDAAADGNAEALRLAAHSLRSSSANVGAKKLSSLAKHLEKIAETDDLSGASDIANQLATEFSAVQHAFDAVLKHRRTAHTA